MSILAKSPDLTKIIKKAVERIGEDHAKSRDHKQDYHGITLKNEDLVIEKALKEASDEMAEKMVLENTIDGMIKETILREQEDYRNIDLTSAPNKRYADFKSSDAWGQLGQYLASQTLWADIDDNIKASAESIGWTEELWNGPGLKQDIAELESEPIYGLWLAGFINDSEDGNDSQLVQAEATIDESTTNTIKKVLNKKLKDKLEENVMAGKRLKGAATIPGKDAYEKSIKKSKSETDAYHKDTKKKFKDYDSFEGNESPEFPHQEDSKTNADGQFQYYRNDDEQEEFIDVNRGMGLQDADGIENLAKISDYLEGSSETGNAQTDDDGEALGNVVPSDLGKKMQKTMKLKKKKYLDDLNTMSNDKRYSPDIQKVKTVKEDVVNDMNNMKKLWSYNKKTQ